VFVRSRAVVVVTLVLAASLLGACGSEGGTTMPSSGAEPSSSLSGAEPPSPSPVGPSSVAPRDGVGTHSSISPSTRPPKTGPSGPSDYIPGDIVAGRVVKGGSGPCYAVLTDDDRRYALHSDAGLVLEEGTYIRAKVGPLLARIDCGEGIPREMISFNRL
jgi:hypothetical protein